MAVPTFTLPYTGTPPWFSGTAASPLVPNIFPVSIDGRPYMVDQKSGRFQRGYEQRVRDSQDISTAPGEAAINPGGLWRRGQDSWHWGAGQQYADVAESKDYLFYKSKGIDPWTKGQVSLLHATKVAYTQTDTSKNVRVVATAAAVFVTDGSAVKYTTDPYASTPSWTSVSGLPALTPRDIATDGTNVYLTYAGTTNSYGLWKINASYTAANYAYGHELGEIGYAKGRLIVGAAYLPSASPPYGDDIYYDPSGNIGGDSDEVKITPWEWIGFAGGLNAIYAAGVSGNKSVIYKITVTAAGALDKLVAALELPLGEKVSAIYSYLGYIIIGSSNGVRYCNTDSLGNLVAGPLIATSGPVYGFTAEDRFVWFTWTNYDGVSGGLGRMDLSVFTQPNLPAFATDLMYDSTGTVSSVTSFSNKRLFAVNGVGLVAEDSSTLVASATFETGVWRWGIPDRKFVAKVDTRATPLVGTITPYLQIDDGDWQKLATWDIVGETETSVDGSDNKAIEAAFKFELTRATTSTGPTLTRWMARAYVSPYRSQVFVIPVLLHRSVMVKNKEYFYDVEEHQSFFDSLIESPRIVTLQIGKFTHTVIVDDVSWESSDAHGNSWSFDGTLVVTLRSVEN